MTLFLVVDSPFLLFDDGGDNALYDFENVKLTVDIKLNCLLYAIKYGRNKNTNFK